MHFSVNSRKLTDIKIARITTDTKEDSTGKTPSSHNQTTDGIKVKNGTDNNSTATVENGCDNKGYTTTF